MTHERKQTNWRAWFVGILIALAVIVALQNSQKVNVDILFLSTSAPLIVMLLVFLAIGAVIGYVGPVLRRHRHRQKRGEPD
jgi:uncharacterized integral membrane protein